MERTCDKPEPELLTVSETTRSTTTSSTHSSSLIPVQQFHTPNPSPAAGAVLALHTSNIGAGGKTKQTRTSLNDGDRLQLVRLCVKAGEQYLGVKHKFWAARAQELENVTGKKLSDPRSTVDGLLKKFEDDIKKDKEGSANVNSEANMIQALRAFKLWVDRDTHAQGAAKNTSVQETETQRQKRLIDQENMLVTRSKKRVFKEGVAALNGDSSSEDSDSTGHHGLSRSATAGASGHSALSNSRLGEAAKGKQTQKKRRVRERQDALDDQFMEQDDKLISVVERLADRLIATSEPSKLSGKQLEQDESRPLLVKDIVQMKEQLRDIHTTTEGNSKKIDKMMDMLAKLAEES